MTRPTKLLIIVGPTAVGKSALAVKLACHIAKTKLGGYAGAEIISADSRQVYRGLNVGAGKITRQEMKGVPHHLLDVADPRARSKRSTRSTRTVWSARFTAEKYCRLAEKAICDINGRGKLPIICGGTGFYIDALLGKIGGTPDIAAANWAGGTFLPPIKSDEKLRHLLASKKISTLLAMLRKLDPVRAQTIEASNSERNNPRRIIRAIEIAKAMKSSKLKVQSAKVDQLGGPEIRNSDSETLPPKYAPLWIGLTLPREELRARIRKRLVKRLGGTKSGGASPANNMIAEARRLHAPRPRGMGLSWKRMEELGLEYRYLARYLQGKITRDEMITKLDIEISRYAKRQMTWFRRNKEIRWYKAA